MQIAINGIYQLAIPRNIWNDKISYVSKITAPKFVWWKEINNKKIKVKSATHLVTEFYIVNLVKDFNQPFYVAKNYLTKWEPKLKQCDCDSYILLWRGCVCGAFKQEQELNSANS